MCTCESIVHLLSADDMKVKLITVNHCQVHTTLKTLRRSLGQRSRSACNGHRNVVDAIAPEPTKVFARKLTQVFPIVRPRTDQIMSLKVTVRKHLLKKCIFITSPSFEHGGALPIDGFTLTFI